MRRVASAAVAMVFGVVTAAVSLVGPAGAAVASSAAQTPPTVTLTAPAPSAVYRQGQVVTAAYGCSSVTAIASCTGDVANGAPLDTGSPGPHLFKVAALDSAGNPTTVAHAYRVIAGTPTVIGPTDVGALGGGPVNISGAKATVKIAAPAANGGQLGVGDTVRVDWALYRSTVGFPYEGNNGPNPLVWTFPAGSHTVIDGPVTVDEKGLHGETRGNAHSGSGHTGVISVSPSNPAGASQVVVSFDDDSSPGFTGSGDGVLVHVAFTLRVTGPGTITVPGFPGLTGRDCVYEGQRCSSFNTGSGIGGTGVSFQALDTVAPTITITTPAQGALVAPGAVVHAAYACTDDSGSTSLCQGDVANGAALDTAASGPHQIHVTSADADGNLAEAWSTYIVDDPSASVGSCSATLGFSCSFPVTLSNPSLKPVSVSYATTDGTATAASGAYQPTAGTLTFGPGTTTQQVGVSVPTTGHAGTFTLNLSAPVNATLGTATGTGTIAGPPPAASVADASAVRPATGTTPLDFTVTLASPALAPVTIHYATSNGTATGLIDYTPTSGILQIPAGQSTGHVVVPIIGSQSDEPAKTFTITLTNPQQATLDRAIATGTIGANHLLAGCSPDDSRVQRYVCHVYLDALRRAAEPAGKAYWVNLIEGGSSRSHMARLYFDTPEARQVQVDRLYVLYLARHGDAAGVAYWAGRLQRGATPDDVRVLLLSSPEYFTKAGASNRAFIAQMYNDVLRRAVDPGGSAYWTGLLDHGTSRAAAAGSFLHTPEGRSAVIGDVYLRFLRRIPGPDEANGWVSALSHGSTEVDIDIAVVASTEYFDRA